MKEAIAVVHYDPATAEVEIDFSPDFYKRDLKEQESVIFAIKRVVEDELEGVREEIVDKLESDIAELQAKAGAAA